MTVPKDESITISFRLPAASHERLVALSVAAGTTPHQFARSLVVLHLDQGNRGFDEFNAIQCSLEQLRFAFGKGFEAMLLNVTDLSPEDVRKWVFERIVSGKDGSP